MGVRQQRKSVALQWHCGEHRKPYITRRDGRQIIFVIRKYLAPNDKYNLSKYNKLRPFLLFAEEFLFNCSFLPETTRAVVFAWVAVTAEPFNLLDG